MDNDTLGDYWRDVSPILKEKAKEWLYEELKQLQENVKLGDDK